MSSSNTSGVMEMTLVDLESPPRSPLALRRVNSVSLLPRFSFNQESLIPTSPAQKKVTVVSHTPETPPTSAPPASAPSQTLDVKEDDPQEELASPPLSPIDNSNSPIPHIEVSDSPVSQISKRNRTTSNSTASSAASKGSLSASATPFTFVKKPRQLSIVRHGSPPTFNFDKQGRQVPSPPSDHGQVSPSDTKDSTLPPYPYTSSYQGQDAAVNPYGGSINLHALPISPISSSQASKPVRIVSPPADEQRNSESLQAAHEGHSSRAPLPAVTDTSLTQRHIELETDTVFGNGSRNFEFASLDELSFPFGTVAQRDLLQQAIEISLPVSPSACTSVIGSPSGLTSHPIFDTLTSPTGSPSANGAIISQMVETQNDPMNTGKLDHMNDIVQSLTEIVKQFVLSQEEAVQVVHQKMAQTLKVMQSGVTLHGHCDASDADNSRPNALEDQVSDLELQITTLKATISTLNDEAQVARSEVSLAEAKNKVIKNKLQDVIEDLHRSETDKLHLMQKCYKIKKALNRSMEEKAKRIDNEEPFAVILLEGHPRMFSHDQVKEGYAGGKNLAQQLSQTARAICKGNMPDMPVERILIELYLDVHLITKQLRVVGTVKDIGHMHSFLDGLIADCSSYYCDAEGPGGPANRVKERIKLYSSLDACKLILIGTSQSQNCVRFLSQLKGDRKDKCHLVQSTSIPLESRSDLDSDKIHDIDGLFTLSTEEWRYQYDAAKRMSISETSSVMSSEVSEGPSRPSSRMSTSTIRQGSLGLGDTGATTPTPKRSLASRITPGPSGNISHFPYESSNPPWNHLSPEMASETESVQQSTSSIGRRHQVSPPNTHRATSTRSSATRTASTSRIVIPIGHDAQTEIGMSPPDSDEDDPSVQLPHSAVKKIQRPTVIQSSRSDDEDEEGLPAGFRPHQAQRVWSSIASPEAGSNYGQAPPWHQPQRRESKSEVRSWKDVIGKQPKTTSRSLSSAFSAFSEANTVPLSDRRAFDSVMPDIGSQGDRGYKTRRQNDEYMTALLVAVVSKLPQSKTMSPSLPGRDLP
ncbi:uncharacterized protein I303_105401 [Kwoniella dejecticola CBS 10117]|uniref:DUF7923 domain-containing protein n=1 Tax=Kwoniella dejecticola CBS 10117 TaxID=1296121 RepID=A0A1A6A2L0_9TREE|nr:uncharacterized protein I303_05153 [Kwoniella dejecticola CBS 10117]OBR84296.1 hypothetical protein I303_05153 [Kwoniella dejecticola CBS 10117]